MMAIIRKFISLNIYLSTQFDKLIFGNRFEYRIDGNNYVKKITSRLITKDMSVTDIGGGKRPHFPLTKKNKLNLNIQGIDISIDELKKAPSNLYDTIIASPIENFNGNEDRDLAVSIAVFEHVNSTSSALKAINSILKPGGIAVVFVPCRNSAFARLNMLIPETIKQKILFSIFPEKVSVAGFPAFYDQCTPSKMKRNAELYGFAVTEEYYFFTSIYFMFFTPFHIIWRFFGLAARMVCRNDACETFILVLKKSY